MPIEFRCPNCQKLLRTPDESAGKKAKCPQCSSIVDVPLASLPPLTPTTPPSPEFRAEPPTYSSGASGNPFSERTGSGGAKNTASSAPVGNENPYATFSAPTTMPAQTWSSVSKGMPVHTLVSFDEIFRGTWDFFQPRIGPFALLGGVTLGISIALNIVSSMLNAVAQAMRNQELVLAVTIIFGILGAVFQVMLSAGQVLYILRLVRTGETKINELWAGIRFTFPVIGYGIVVMLLASGAFTIFALPVGVVALAIGPQNIDRNPLPVVGTGIFMALGFIVLWSWVSIRLILAICFMVDRERGVFGSLLDSWKFMSGNALTGFLVFVVVGLLGSLFTIATCCVGQVLAQPYFTLTTVMLYLYATGQMRTRVTPGSEVQLR